MRRSAVTRFKHLRGGRGLVPVTGRSLHELLHPAAFPQYGAPLFLSSLSHLHIKDVLTGRMVEGKQHRQASAI